MKEIEIKKKNENRNEIKNNKNHKLITFLWKFSRPIDDFVTFFFI
jgi:hypothetical protein